MVEDGQLIHSHRGSLCAGTVGPHAVSQSQNVASARPGTLCGASIDPPRILVRLSDIPDFRTAGRREFQHLLS
jgi:hypothetical protein